MNALLIFVCICMAFVYNISPLQNSSTYSTYEIAFQSREISPAPTIHEAGIDDCPQLRDEKASDPSIPNELKYVLYQYMDTFAYSFFSNDYPWPASIGSAEALAYFSSFGLEAVPYMLQYVIEHQYYYSSAEYGIEWMRLNHILACAYEIMGEPDCNKWPSIDGDYHAYVSGPYAEYLLNYIEENGLRPLYPFLSTEEAANNRERIYMQLDEINVSWKLYQSLDDYEEQTIFITNFGEYAVPHILSYIMEHEGQELTADKEMNLGVLLHCAYRMLGVESTADWHMPAEPVSSTTDPFPYTRELIAHLGDYGLTMPDSSTP